MKILNYFQIKGDSGEIIRKPLQKLLSNPTLHEDPRHN